MTVNINKPQINLREQLKKLERPTTDKLAVKGHNGVLLDPLTGELNLQGIDSGVGGAAVDVFVYDTSKDSDGGAWRKRTQSTSWYNEALNTSTRGSRKEFPAVAVIVVETTKVTIYDGDDPDLPMWMVFNTTSGNLIGAGTLRGVTALNGIMVTPSSGYTMETRFISDYSLDWFTNQLYEYKGNIEQRNDTLGFKLIESYGIVNSASNDVAMTVLPNAPIDSATGLPIPTIAVATDGGTSVIRDDGSVIDYKMDNPTYNQVSFVEFLSDNRVGYTTDHDDTPRRFFVTPIRGDDTTTVSSVSYPRDEYETVGYGRPEDNKSVGNYHGHLIGNDQSIAASMNESMIAVGDGSDGLNLVDVQAAGVDIFDSKIAFITKDYNTGWQHGNIKGTFLSDTDPLGSELITNGTFGSNIDNWRSFNATLTHATDSIRVGDGPGSWSKAYQSFNTVVGKQYQVKIVVKAISGGSATASVGAQNPAKLSGNDTTIINSQTSTGTYFGYFTATATTSYVEMASDGTNYVDYSEVSVTNAVCDRSTGNNHLRQYGTITKQPVATGADLVAYSGFTAANYLSYNASDMAFGTGDFSVSVWCIPSTDTTNEFILELDNASSGSNRFYLLTTATATKKLYLPWNADVSGSELTTGQWNHVVVGRQSGVGYVYVNGNNIPAGTIAWTNSLNGNGNGTISNYSAGPSNDYAWSGSLALLRISGSAPSAEQVKKMYEDEKCLFQENAKATLYGSSDAVTALAYDSTTSLLHVGTSGGRSTFSGLKRVENTTTAVTTAISASNGLVAEQ